MVRPAGSLCVDGGADGEVSATPMVVRSTHSSRDAPSWRLSLLCVGTRMDTSIDMAIDMWTDMSIDMGIDMWMDISIDMVTDIGIDMWMDISIDMVIDKGIDMWMT